MCDMLPRIAAAVWLTAVSALAGAPRPVGELADPRRLAFQGNIAFSAEAIVEGLSGDLDFVQAAHPCAPLQAYTDVVRAKLLLGYLRNGFPSAKVAVALDETAKRVNVTITEGPRFVNGAIEIVGAEAVSEADLRKWLTTQRREVGSKKVAVWQAGEPAWFDSTSTKWLAGQVRVAYSHFGRFFPDVAVKVVPDRGGRTARLRVIVRHEGPKAVVGSIEVTGAKRNLPEHVVEHLGVRVGMPLDGAAVEDMKRKLWHSGRFLKFDVTLEEPDELTGQVRLAIRVKEYDKAPPLTEELSVVDRALLRMRDRLDGFENGDLDLVLTAAGGAEQIEAVLSPRHGILVRSSSPGQGRDAVLLFGYHRVGSYELSGPGKGGIESAHNARFTATVFMGADPSEEAERPFHLRIGAATTTAKADDPAFSADVTLEPVAFLGLARREGLEATVADGVVTLRGDAFLLRAREATGEIEKLTLPAFLMGQSLEVQLVGGRFEEHRKALDALPRETVRQASGPELWSALVARFAPRLLVFSAGSAENMERAARAVVRLIGGVTAVLAEAGEAKRQEGEAFDLPPTPGAKVGGIGFVIARLAIPAARRLFPEGSWPLAIVGESALVVCGRGKYTTTVLGQLYQSEDTGPVGCLTTAWLLTYVNVDMARVFARRGLERLSVGAFRRDARLVLEGEKLLGEALLGLTRAVRDLDDADVGALETVLAPELGGMVGGFLRSIRSQTAQAEPREALAAALDQWWNNALRARVAQALQGIATRE